MSFKNKFWLIGAGRTNKHFGGVSLTTEGPGIAGPFTFLSTIQNWHLSPLPAAHPQTLSGLRAERGQ
jgi:hypothetical protein